MRQDGPNGAGSQQGTAVMTITLIRADMNCDGGVDFDDIKPFVKCVVNGGCP